MPKKRDDSHRMASFRLSAESQHLLEQTAKCLTEAGPVQVNKTDVLEMAIRDWCRKNLKKHSKTY